MDHEKRQAKYQEARAPVKALRAEIEEATTAAERRKLREKLRQAMKDSSRHLYADMNAQSTMGAEIEDGKVEVDFHGLHVKHGVSLCGVCCANRAHGHHGASGHRTRRHSKEKGYSELREEVRRVAKTHGFEATLTTGGVEVSFVEGLDSSVEEDAYTMLPAAASSSAPAVTEEQREQVRDIP